VEIMATIATLVLAVLTAQAALRGRARRKAALMMRPAEQWTDADTQHWLGLIEPFPLHVEEQEYRW
jgi:hypothetical protein